MLAFCTMNLMVKTADDVITIIRGVTMCLLALVLVGALCATLFFKNYADPTTLVTIVGLAGTCVGYLAGKRSNQQDDTTKLPDGSAPVKVVNQPSEPIPTEERATTL